MIVSTVAEAAATVQTHHTLFADAVRTVSALAQAKCSVSEMKTRLTSRFPACLLGVSSENQDINCETEH